MNMTGFSSLCNEYIGIKQNRGQFVNREKFKSQLIGHIEKRDQL